MITGKAFYFMLLLALRITYFYTKTTLQIKGYTVNHLNKELFRLLNLKILVHADNNLRNITTCYIFTYMARLASHGLRLHSARVSLGFFLSKWPTKLRTMSFRCDKQELAGNDNAKIQLRSTGVESNTGAVIIVGFVQN